MKRGWRVRGRGLQVTGTRRDKGPALLQCSIQREWKQMGFSSGSASLRLRKDKRFKELKKENLPAAGRAGAIKRASEQRGHHWLWECSQMAPEVVFVRILRGPPPPTISEWAQAGARRIGLRTVFLCLEKLRGGGGVFDIYRC